MNAHLDSLLEESVTVAQRQLAAARVLDADGLRRATARRQDLLFELSLSMPQPEEVSGDPAFAARLDELRRLDERLTRVLSSGLRVLDRVLPSGPPRTYAADGRLRRVSG